MALRAGGSEGEEKGRINSFGIYRSYKKLRSSVKIQERDEKSD
jgi:hypothetical protein